MDSSNREPFRGRFEWTLAGAFPVPVSAGNFDIAMTLDYTTLEPYPGSYVTDDLRRRADDVVWRVKAEGEWI